MSAAKLHFSRQVADAIPFRVLTFLRTVKMSREIRSALIRAGYTQADHAFAWEKLLAITGYRMTLAPAAPTGGADAILLLDGEDETLLRRAEAALRRFHPGQAEFVFANLAPGAGADAVIAITTFLERLDALESDPARAATRAEDGEALAKLAARGITKEERTRLARLVKRARAVEDAPASSDSSAEQVANDVTKLRAWYQDWSDTARAVIKRRDFLIRLGLARRKATEKTREPARAPEMPIATGDATP